MAEKPVKANLFRFVTLRNPQLIEEKDKEPGFVIHPDESSSPFYSAVEGKPDEDKPVLLQAVSDNFGAFKTRTKLKDTYKDLYYFSSWLMRNKNALTYKSIVDNINEAVELTSSEEIESVWENLIYQTVNRTSVYVREACIQLLIANKFLAEFLQFADGKDVDYEFKEEELKDFTRRAHAKVVISNVLFSSEKSSEKPKHRSSSKSDLHEIAITGAEYNRVQYEKAITELKKIEAQFKKDNREAYETALVAHQASVKSLIDATTPTIVEITDEFGNVTSVKTYPDLELPVFDFDEKTVIDDKYLLDKVSEDTINILKTNQLDGFTDFSNIYSGINKLKKDELNIIFKSKQALKPKPVTVRGASFRTGSTPAVAPYCFSSALQVSATGNTIIGMKLTTDYQNPLITDATFQVKYDGTGTVKNGLSVNNITSLNNVIKTHFVFENLPMANGSQLTFSGQFTLNNGITYTFSVTGIVQGHPFDPRKTLLAFKGCAELKDGETGNDNTESLADAPVYGVTSLGIADFRRVEQEVCCYVPGEVSHIENIMAREFKERSTRSLVSSEITDERSEERELENLTDTTTTERNEMQSEVAAVLNEDESESFGANASVSSTYNGANGSTTLNAGAGFDTATANSSSNSNSQAQTYAQEVTERAMERIVQKTQTKRTSRILKEFEENNSHGFDNRKGDKHISGVYRWVDKIYKNQLINYGKRLMYEFAIPEPSKFFKEAIIKNVEDGTADSAVILPTAPEHPSVHGMNSAFDLDGEYQTIAAHYNAEVTAMPEDVIKISHSFSQSNDGDSESAGSSQSGNGEIEIPEGYAVISYDGYLLTSKTGASGYAGNADNSSQITVEKKRFNVSEIYGYAFRRYHLHNDELDIRNVLAYSFSSWVIGGHALNLEVECKFTVEAQQQWQNETYNAIMEAYEEKLRLYNEAMQVNEVIPEDATEKLRFNPLENRALEKRELKRIAIELLALQKGHVTSKDNYSYENDIAKVHTSEELQKHLATVKFFEQAFDWEIMSYIFYPYFYADEANWKELFQQQEAADPIFQSFLQSGMARTVVPVRKGFEDAVNWYMITGEMWNGEGLVVDQDNDLYVSVAEEMQTVEGEVEKAWETRLPTSLTVIQAGAIGLNVQGLPCNSDCETGSLFDSDENQNPIGQLETLIGGDNTDVQDQIDELSETLDTLKDKVEEEHPEA
ncbi:hypothetical protein [Psychroserpens sp.]